MSPLRLRFPDPLLALGIGVILTSPAQAQEDVPSGTTLTFEIEPRLRVSDNISLEAEPEGTTYLSETGLSFGFSSETELQTLDLDLDAVIRLAEGEEISEDASGLGDPRLGFSYTRESANSRVTATAFYRQVDLDFDDPLDDETISGDEEIAADEIAGEDAAEDAGLVDESLDFDENDLIDDTGTRTTYATDLSYETGLSQLLGYEVSLGLSDTDYSGTSDPDLFDSHTETYAVTAFARFSATTEANVRLARRDYTADEFGGRERTSNSLSFGLQRAFSPQTTLDAQIGVREVDESFDLFPGLSSTERGAIGTFVVSRALPDGRLSATLDRSFNEDGGRTRLEISRALTLPAGSVSVSVGATRGEDTEAQAIADLGYTRLLPRGQISASLSRSVDIDNDTDETSLITRAELSYRVDVNRISDVSMNVDYATAEQVSASELDDDPDEGSQGSLRAAYNRDLSPAWGLSAGYEYRFEDDSDADDAEANEIFLTLNRRFAIRP